MSLPLDNALAQCARHAQILMQALRDMPRPLTEQHLQNPAPELLRLVDQFVLRFTKLQDTMGTHVLRQFVAHEFSEPIEDAPFSEVLGVLEREGIFAAHAWGLQRGVRNALTHEYPEDLLRIVLALNDAQYRAQQLIEWFGVIQARMQKT